MLNALLIAGVLSAYPSPAQQRRLMAGLTMTQVIDAMGEPDSVEQTTCGANTPKPWQCRLWDYRDGNGRVFTLMFDWFKAAWTLNSWRSFSAVGAGVGAMVPRK